MEVIEQSLKNLSTKDADNPSAQWLQDIQRRGQALWRLESWPNRKTEAWRYTHLGALEKHLSNAKPKAKPNGRSAGPATHEKLHAVLQQYRIPNMQVCRLVFIDGEFNPNYSDELPAGLQAVSFSSADTAQARVIAKKLGSVVDTRKHLFTSLNESQLRDGIYLYVEPSVEISQVVQLLCLSTGSKANINQRVLLELAENAKLHFLEHHVSLDEAPPVFVNATSEFILADNAKLEHYRLNLENESALHIGGVHASLGCSSSLNSFYLTFGSTLKRLDATVKHQGKGAESQLNGIYLPRKNQHIDVHTLLEHCVPHTRSQEVFRGIIADTARAVFNGSIFIHPQAQKTHAQLSNKNLLTSHKAEVDTKPELEIYANDVQCAHGATVAQLDDNLLHYFRTRGVGKQTARRMLAFGFINELLEGVSHSALMDYMQPRIAQWFAESAESIEL